MARWFMEGQIFNVVLGVKSTMEAAGADLIRLKSGRMYSKISPQEGDNILHIRLVNLTNPNTLSHLKSATTLYK